MEESKNKLWMRVGCVFWVTPEEADILLSCSSDTDERTDLLRRLVLDGHFAAGGRDLYPWQVCHGLQRSLRHRVPER